MPDRTSNVQALITPSKLRFSSGPTRHTSRRAARDGSPIGLAARILAHWAISSRATYSASWSSPFIVSRASLMCRQTKLPSDVFGFSCSPVESMGSASGPSAPVEVFTALDSFARFEDHCTPGRSGCLEQIGLFGWQGLTKSRPLDASTATVGQFGWAEWSIWVRKSGPSDNNLL